MSIAVRRSLLDHLKEFASQAFSIPGDGSACVLLGRVEHFPESGQRVITVEDLDTGLSALHGQAAVGFVRFRRQRALHLAKPDYLTLKENPELVCLIIRPDANDTAMGGFFFRDGRTVLCPPDSMQFSIDSTAADCRRPFTPLSEEPVVEETPSSPMMRLFYGTLGMALLLLSVTVWLAGR